MTGVQRIRAVLLFPAIALAIGGGAADIAALDGPPAVALVAAVDGAPRARLPAKHEFRPLKLFDRLPPGVHIETGADDRVLIVFRSGARVRLQPGSSAFVGESQLKPVTGKVERLASVPTIPIFDLPGSDLPLGRVAAVRIRGDEFRGLYPRTGARSLADATTLSFVPGRTFAHYDVDIADAHGRVVFSQRVDRPKVDVPAATLLPASQYMWRVSARTPSGTVVHGEADFVTLTSEQAAWRQSVRQGIDANDPEWLWLAEIDLALGLIREARAAFQSHASVVGDDVIAARLAAIDRALQPPAAGAR